MEKTNNISESELKKSERAAALKIKAEYKGLQRYSNVLRVQKKDLQQILDKMEKDVDPAPLKILIYPPTSAETIKAAQGEDITELKPLTSDLEASKDKGENSATKPLSSTSAVFLDDSISNSHELPQTKVFLEMPTDHSAKDEDALDFPTIFPSTDEAKSSDEASIALDYPSVLPREVMVPPDNPSEPLQMFVSEENLSNSEPRPDTRKSVFEEDANMKTEDDVPLNTMDIFSSPNLSGSESDSSTQDANMKTEDDIPLNKLGEKSRKTTPGLETNEPTYMPGSCYEWNKFNKVDQSSNKTLHRMVSPGVYTEERCQGNEPSLGNHQPDSEPEEIPLAKSESGESLEMSDLDVEASSLGNHQPDSEPEEIPLANSESGQSLEMSDLDVESSSLGNHQPDSEPEEISLANSESGQSLEMSDLDVETSSLGNHQPDSEPEEIPLADSESGQSLEMSDLDVEASEALVEVLKSTQGSEREKVADETYIKLFSFLFVCCLAYLFIYMLICIF
ncbi:uncharacterized protein [Drosophila bipectinata]|uniref:uncharacterized protein n=1 Tax=Drosophila bipectinata TaxID=42026 RepID=UPI001C895781|nr:uncharacterized protein LOC108127153 [Drosophila bipectinata]